jgi:cysteinyl-tRNA synthetase
VFDSSYGGCATGYDVTYVRNITDIDDKIIRRAAENGETINALTERFIRAMNEDCAASVCSGRRTSRVRRST